MAGDAPLFVLPFFDVPKQFFLYLPLDNVVFDLVLHYRVPHSLGVSTTLTDQRLWQCSGETEITDLYLTFRIQKNVRRFNVSVNYVRRVAEAHGTEDVVDYCPKVFGAKFQVLPFLHEHAQVHLFILHNQENHIQLVTLLDFRNDDIDQVGNEVAPLVLGDFLEVGHDLYLPNDLAAVVVKLGEVLNQFDCDLLFCGFGDSFDYCAEATFAKYLE